MTVGVLTVKLYAPWVHSLKEKRMIVKGLCDRLRNKFNVSVIQSGAQDIHQTILISVAFIAASAALADSMAENITGFIESNTDAQIVDITFENR